MNETLGVNRLTEELARARRWKHFLAYTEKGKEALWSGGLFIFFALLTGYFSSHFIVYLTGYYDAPQLLTHHIIK